MGAVISQASCQACHIAKLLSKAFELWGLHI